MSLDDLSSPLRIAGESGRSVSDTRERVSHDVSIVEVEGPRVPVNGELLHRVLFLLRHGERHIVLNLAHVSRIDAAGVGGAFVQRGDGGEGRAANYACVALRAKHTRASRFV